MDKGNNPQIPTHVLEYLERMFPARPPELKDRMRKVWFDAGRRSVVEHLRGLFNEQNENILEKR